MFDIDLSPVINIVVMLLAGLLSAVGAWALAAVRRKFDIDAQSQLGQVMDQALNRGLDYAVQRARALGVAHAKVPISNELLATAATYVIGAVPRTMQQLGVSERDIVDKLTARLREHPAIDETKTVADSSPAPARAG